MNKIPLFRWVMVLLVTTMGHAWLNAGDAAPAVGAAPVVQHVDGKAAQSVATNKNVVVLDVRTPAEFQQGHIAGATNINLHSPDFEKKVGQLDTNKTYLVHCAAGVRSAQSIPVLQRNRLRNLIHLDGGLRAWEKAGGPVEK